MKWYRNLYIGFRAKEKIRRIIWKTRHGKLQNNVFLLTLPTNEENLLDIIPANILLQPYFKRKEVWIAGIAVGREEAMEVLEVMVQKVLEETGQVNLKEYLKKQDWK